MRLTKDTKNKIERKSKELNIEEYDLQVKIVTMSLDQQLKMEEDNKVNSDNMVKNMILNCCVDEENNPIFETLEEVGNLPADISKKIFIECISLNNLAEKDLDKLAKNS